ncbi:MAG: hypothetical protein R3C59_30980 [Planctomycetaceae bacterium]
MSNESEPGTPVLLTYLFGTRQSWKSLPELHWNRCLATQCYRAAVEEARERFDRHMDGRQQGESLSDVDFELLLRLYQCDDWFRHLKAELALGEADKGPHRAARNLLASAICEDAEPNVKLPAEFERTASSLQSLQEEWGIPWMLAIEVLPYRWDLHS